MAYGKQDVFVRFIRAYRDFPMLWDVTSEDYLNKGKKTAAYDELLSILREVKPDAVREDVKKKINSLRTNYRKEVKKINDFKMMGQVYEPTGWTFKELSFLGSENMHCRNFSSFVMGEHEEDCRDDDRTSGDDGYGPEEVLTVEGEIKVEDDAKDLSDSMFSISNVVMPQHHSPPPAPPLPLPPHVPSSGGGGGPMLKRKRPGQFPYANDPRGGALPNVDTEEVTAKYWALKLKFVKKEQRLFAEKFINDILLEAELGTLHRNSVQINNNNPNVTETDL
ncbi:uncharacterized protein LOC143037247 [Oratosquilla oratoria]|uniref:uncharacterized protein LOC143037247 n=1 Tax=Oratosquilla oratoria TaxID=337810 RepID=UPI003F776EF6